LNARTVGELYRKLLAHDAGMRNVKFDLHIHTPASRDFNSRKTVSDDDVYLDLLNSAIASDIEIIAFTDHNTFSGYNRLQEMFNADPTVKQKYCNLLVLCGIEITCFSKHILAIFDATFSMQEQDKFLSEIGISEDERGCDTALADLFGPTILLEKIAKYGGIAVLAHADSEKGFLYSICRNSGDKQDEIAFSGQTLAKIIKSPYLFGIQIANQGCLPKLRDKLANTAYRRNDRSLGYLFFSDCHGQGSGRNYTGKSGKPIGQSYSKAKMSQISFLSLKMALADPDVRIVDDESSDYKFPAHIIGCAINSSVLSEQKGGYCFVRFNPEMNCIIGARGTGKSTIIEIMQHIIALDGKKEIERPFSSAVLFVAAGKKVIAISLKRSYMTDSYTKAKMARSKIEVFAKEEAGGFQSCTANPPPETRDAFSIGYQQRKLGSFRDHPEMMLEIIDDFSRWKYKKEYSKAKSQVEYFRVELEDQLKTIRRSAEDRGLSFVEYIDEESLVSRISFTHEHWMAAMSQLHKLRKKMLSELNDVLKGKVNLTLYRSATMEQESFNYHWDFVHRARAHSNLSYEFSVEIRRMFGNKVDFLGANYQEDFNFFRLLLKKEYETIIKQYNLNPEKGVLHIDAEKLKPLRACLSEEELLFCFRSGIHFEYNINSGKGQPALFRKSNQLSMGQHAVAVLLLILDASFILSDGRPLIMDQPEDDLDNSYIYNTLVSEFRLSKTKRQIIISTHNANIPVASDAENIIVLKHNGETGYIANNGSLDKPEIADSVLKILEGGKEAMRRREAKYQDFI